MAFFFKEDVYRVRTQPLMFKLFFNVRMRGVGQLLSSGYVLSVG